MEQSVNVDLSIRGLTQKEREMYYGACIEAVNRVPAFRDSIALLRPFYDGTANTAYTDVYARVGLSPLFFNELTNSQRSAFVLHEVMHVLNNHFSRFETIGATGQDAYLGNIAGDFEINSGLITIPMIDMWNMILPNHDPFKFKMNLSMENYYSLLKKLQKDQNKDQGSGAEGSGDGSGENKSGPSSPSKGRHCDESTEERSSGADEAGIERASETEKNVAKKNTLARVRDEREKARAAGDRAMGAFLDLVELQMTPPKADWRSEFSRAFNSHSDAIIRGRDDYSMRRPSRRRSDSDFIFPGFVRYCPETMWAIDTSGSMRNEDFSKNLSEGEGILRNSSKGALKIFSIDTEMSEPKMVRSVKDIKLIGGGGTDMVPALRYVNGLHRSKRPDIFILSTDGGVFEWDSYEAELRSPNATYRHILLISDHQEFLRVPESLKKICSVIDVS